MSIIFDPTNHTYKSDTNKEENWISVTDIIKKFKEPFDKIKTAEKCSKKKKSKWYGMKPDEIIKVWDTENQKAIEYGNWYHLQRELDVNGCNSISREGRNLSIIPSNETTNGMKIAPDQNITEGIYPEHFIYLKSKKICGQADRVEVIGDRVDIYDYKSNKKIEMNSYVSPTGKKKKMLSPINNLDDCNYWNYALQLSFYMYIILKHNPNLRAGKLILQHVEFAILGEDKYENPIYDLDNEGHPKVNKVTAYDVPYLRNEVQNIINILE